MYSLYNALFGKPSTQETINFTKYGKLQRFGLSIFFNPNVASIKFVEYVEAEDKKKNTNHKWSIWKINSSESVVINANKVATALKIVPEKLEALSFDENRKKINEAYKDEMRKLMRSIKDPSSIDGKVISFAEALFDDENLDTQVIEQRFFEEESPIKLVGFRTLEGKFKIICIHNFEELGKTDFSIVLRVTDVSLRAWCALKCSIPDQGNNQFYLQQEAKAFDLCYGREAKEGTQQIGWEVKPSQLFNFPMSVINPSIKGTELCLLKPYNDKKDLLDFIENGNKMSFEAIIHGCFQLVIGLAKLSYKDLFLLDISLENIWVSTREDKLFDLRLGDFSNLNSNDSIKKNLESLSFLKKTFYRKYVDDKEFTRLKQKVERNKDKETINTLCALAKKIDVFALASCIYSLVDQSLSTPYTCEKVKIDGINFEFAGEILFPLEKDFEFMQPLFERMLAPAEKRISAELLALNFYHVIRKKHPDLAKPFFSELQFLTDNSE